MTSKLYVGNLSFQTTEGELRTLFAEVGGVESVSIVTDRDSGRSRGFAFVEMESEENAQAVIEKFNGHNLGERNLVVNIAKPREEGSRSNSRGGFGGGGGGRRF